MSVTVLRTSAPSLKVTIPVGVPPVEETVAVKVTAVPKVDGFKDETSLVEVFALCTVCVSTAEVLPLKSALPG